MSPDELLLRPYRVRDVPAADAGRFVAEGRHNVEAALRHGLAIESILVTRGKHADLIGKIPAGIPLLQPDAAATDAAFGVPFHLGCAAVVCAPEKRRLAAALPGFFDTPAPRTLVICPCLGDASNLGAIIRNAAALGADAVLCGDRGVSPWSRKAVRAASGTAFSIPVIVSPDLHGDLAEFVARDDTTLSAFLLADNAVPLPDWRPAGRHIALMLGGEAHGLAPEWLAHPHDAVIIPMRPGIDSLNVAAGSAIALYAVAARRG